MPGNARMDRSFVYTHSLAALAAIQLGSFSDLLYRHDEGPAMSDQPENPDDAEVDLPPNRLDAPDCLADKVLTASWWSAGASKALGS